MAVLCLTGNERGAIFRDVFAREMPDLPFHLGEAPPGLIDRDRGY